MMMTMTKSVFTLMALLAMVVSAVAQHTDGAIWTYTGVKIEPIKDVSVEVAEEFRYNVSTADLYQSNAHAQISYRFTKKIKAAGEYRYSVRAGGNTHRWGFGMTFREGFGDLDISYRTKYQYSTAPDGGEGTAWRNKFSIDYTLNKDWAVFGSGELFYTLSNELDQFDNQRYEAGVDFSPNKHHDLTVSYIYDHEYHVNEPQRMHILSIGYVYSF